MVRHVRSRGGTVEWISTFMPFFVVISRILEIIEIIFKVLLD
jgi:hypothetical protein